MQTVRKNLKYAIFIMGTLLLWSCGSGSFEVASEIGVHAISESLPSMTTSATRSISQKISDFFKDSSIIARKKAEKKKESQPKNRMIIPIKIGTIEPSFVPSTKK